MFIQRSRLSRKIVGMLSIFFVVAMLAIGMTLLISWQLEGVAAAINDAGSQRMRTYRIGHLMSRHGDGGTVSPALAEELERFDKVMHDLQDGDPARPLSPPRNPEVAQKLLQVERNWDEAVRPLVVSYLNGEPAQRRLTLQQFDDELENFVSRINEVVLAMERSYALDTNLLRTVQLVLVVLAVLSTAMLVNNLIRLVISPVNVLHAGIRRMAENDLSVRLPVDSDDELGALAHGFNQMAEHLEQVYSTLEERVEAETRRLAQRNHELGILYEATAFLSEPAPLQVLCDGFLDYIRNALGADAGAVRLYSTDSEKLYLMAHEGLSDSFLAKEAEMNCADCLCGEVFLSRMPVAFDTVNPPAGMKFFSCVREGFATATAFAILYDRQQLGVYNLYFRREKAITPQQVHLLETLGHHLGVAIENQRLKSREKELAISEERNLLAQELHDSIAQGLAFLNIQVQLLQDSLKKERIDEALQTAGQLREGVQESYDDVRELLVHFRSRVHQSDLDSAINAALERFEGQTGIATEFERVGTGAPMLAADETQIMHIVQESLSNIRKHARASKVHVVVRRSVGHVEITVRDDGVGFDLVNEPNVKSEWHVGLKIMCERALRVGGECRIVSRPGEGTCVTLEVPRKNGREAENE